RKHAVSYEVPGSVPIPSDVERPDKILAGLTARQVAIAAVAAAVIWAGFQATRHVMPLPAFAALASPAGLAAVALVIGEQDGLPAAYGRWLNSLTGPVQILVRAGRADLSAAVAALRDAAPALPHPALEQAVLEHAAFLDGLAAERDVLTRQALLIVREPG